MPAAGEGCPRRRGEQRGDEQRRVFSEDVRRPAGSPRRAIIVDDPSSASSSSRRRRRRTRRRRSSRRRPGVVPRPRARPRGASPTRSSSRRSSADARPPGDESWRRRYWYVRAKRPHCFSFSFSLSFPGGAAPSAILSSPLRVPRRGRTRGSSPSGPPAFATVSGFAALASRRARRSLARSIGTVALATHRGSPRGDQSITRTRSGGPDRRPSPSPSPSPFPEEEADVLFAPAATRSAPLR